jgi:hypothetical protein
MNAPQGAGCLTIEYDDNACDFDVGGLWAIRCPQSLFTGASASVAVLPRD